jgi:HEAT repeat protein
MAEFVPAAAGAGMAKHLTDGDARVRASAAEVLGAIGAADCAERLFPMLYDEDSRVTIAAARALGGALGKTGGDSALRSRAVTELVDQFPSEGWDLSVACLDGLGAMGGEEAAAALAGIAGDAGTDPRLRGIAIDRLADAGEAAAPHLYRLSFDEAEIGYLVNAVEGRVCDAAVESLNQVLGCPYGRRYELFTADGLTQDQIRGCRDRIVEKVRAEARKRGLAPPAK